MQPFVPLLLASVVILSVSASGGKDPKKMMMHKWMKEKAMESCFGIENCHKFMMMKRRAVAECKGIDAPELELPFFKSPTASPKGNWMQENMKKFMFGKMMNKMNKFEGGREGSYEESGEMPFYKSSGRYRRQAGNDMGAQLLQSLYGEKEAYDLHFGNMTCVCRKMGMIDENDDIDINSMNSMVSQFDLDPWLGERIRQDHKTCYEFSQALPMSFTESCIHRPKIVKLKMFHKCMKMQKGITCMKYDVKRKLEANFGPINELTRSTGLEEDELYPLTMSLLMHHE